MMITDASLHGWGAILFDTATGEIWVTNGVWTSRHESKDINTLEMTAVCLGAQNFAEILQTKQAAPLLLIVDSTSTQHVLSKGFAREFAFNAATAATLREIAGDRFTAVGYINSEANPTDKLSRGVPLSDEELLELPSCLRALGRRVAATLLRVRVPRVVPT